MKITGIDFTSAPTRSKPITAGTGVLAKGQLSIESVRRLASFGAFEKEIAEPGPWVAGIDFPFGQPNRLVQALGWPQPWRACVLHVEDMGKDGFERAVRAYSEGRPAGDKQHRRRTDIRARSLSPMKLDFQPVGKMFFQGTPRILRSGASIVPCAPNDSDRVMVEAYPALAAEALADTRSYKNDAKSRQTSAHEDARRRIVAGLTGERCRTEYGLVVRLDGGTRRSLVNDARGDMLDAVLCALQAAWSTLQPNFGVPETCDPLEGWIVDPSQNRPREQGSKPMYSSESKLLRRISTDPSICHGKPCIRGMRYPVDMVLGLLSSGMNSDEILAEYEDLEHEDILAVLAFAARLSQVKRVRATA